jgi:hypothetical protein
VAHAPEAKSYGERLLAAKALLEDRQSPAVQRLRLGVPVGLGQQSGEVAEAQAGRASRWRLLGLGDNGVDIIAGASLARPTVNLPLSVVKTGCGSRPVCGSEAI